MKIQNKVTTIEILAMLLTAGFTMWGIVLEDKLMMVAGAFGFGHIVGFDKGTDLSLRVIRKKIKELEEEAKTLGYLKEVLTQERDGLKKKIADE